MPRNALDRHHEESHSLDDRELRVALATAAYYARRIARTMRLSDSDQEDLEQDIILTLLVRRRFFDSGRGAWSAFADRVARQAAQALADAIAADRRRRADLLPRHSADDEDAPDDPVEQLVEDDPQALTAFDAVMLSIDLGDVLARLPAELRLVAWLALDEDGDLAAAQRRSELTTSEFYRRMREVRYRMAALELAPVRLLPRRRGTPRTR